MAFVVPMKAQNSYSPQAGEYDIIGSLPGDQVNPAVAIGNAGGYLVWEDNMTDGEGSAIVAQRLGGGLTGQYGSFRVNQQGSGDQQKPEIALFKNGGAVIVWQGNQAGNWDVYAAFLSSNGTFVVTDLLVNEIIEHDQVTPVVTCLQDGSVAIAWGSFHQDGSWQGVYARRFSAEGQGLGGEFRINTSTYLNQRTPSLAALGSGGFVAVWVSEHQSTLDTARAAILGQMFLASGQPMGGEFAVSTTTNICANPAVAANATGGFAVTWGQKGPVNKTPGANDPENSWDIFARTFQPSGKPIQTAAFRVNAHTYGDQYAPRIAGIREDALIVWTSLGQDGSREGVYGQFVSATGAFLGGETAVNTTTLSQQIHPAVASDGQLRLLTVWSGYTIGDHSFDLQAQRFEAALAPLDPPAAPYVTALSQSRLSVAWPGLAGFQVTAYEVYVDGAITPVLVTSNSWTATGLAEGSTHSFEIAYRLADGRTSPKSSPTTGKTWAEDGNWDGLPDDWQAQYWGAAPSGWPAGILDSDGDGVSNLHEFLAGTNPRDAASVLKTRISSSEQGFRLNWNTEVGLIYQVQESTNFGAWANLGSPRLAAGSQDSIAVDGSKSGSFYRIVRVR